MFKRFFAALILITLTLALNSSIAFAAAPAWSSGFPKLVKTDALLQWNPVSGAAEYKIYKDGKLLTAVKTNRHIDKGLAAGKTFSYAVAAVVGGKEGERSEKGSVTSAKEKVFVPLKTPKLVGAHVKEQAGGKVAVGIRWEGAEGTNLVGINVYRSTVKGKDYAMVGSSSADTFEDKDVQRGETYYYVATAVDNQFNETKYSNEVDVSVPAPVAKEEAPKQAAKVETTTMRPAKLLFTIPAEQDALRKGYEEYKLGTPLDVAVDEAVGHIYVTSPIYGGVLVYDMEGRLQFGIRKDGVGGSQRFGAAKCVALGKNGNIYITDFKGPTISVFDFTGKPLKTIDVDISHLKGGKARNVGIAVDQDENIYVAEPVSNTIQVFNSQGKRLYEVLGARTEEEAKKKNKIFFNAPGYMTLVDDGFVFVDGAWSKMVYFGKGGKFKRFIGKPGSNAGELYYPMGVAMGKKGEIFIASAMSPNVQVFNTEGKFLYALCNEKSDGPIPSNNIRGIHIDSQDRLYVVEEYEGQVSVYKLNDRTIEIIPEL